MDREGRKLGRGRRTSLSLSILMGGGGEEEERQENFFFFWLSIQKDLISASLI